MFAVYNNGSVGFRSTADNLYNLKNVDEVADVRLKPDEGFIQEMSKRNPNQGEKFSSEALNSYKKMANIDTLEPVYHVKDIMTKEVFYIDNKSTIKEAYDLLHENKIAQIPVISFGKKIIGMISKKIILNLIMSDIENIQNVLDRKIEDVSLPEIITAEPISDIRRVAKVMIDFKLDAIPIVDEESILLGIVSKTDILKAVSFLPKLQLWS